MTPATYPFAAIVGQSEMKLALLLAAVDWRLGVLLRGDKGSGKTTTARGLAALLPSPAPFVNLPIGATEDRLLGGLHLERALKGEAVLKPGLLSQAHGGVLYVDEINLLPAHLGDALLDTAASGINVIEREGLSASHSAEFILLGSMNPEEGSLRPQLLDRFALAVDVAAPHDPAERRTVVERRMSFEEDRESFFANWSAEQKSLKDQVVAARAFLKDVLCSGEIIGEISTAICSYDVRSLRADLAAMRAAKAYAALLGAGEVQVHHVEMVLPLVLAHRARDRRSQSSRPKEQPRPPQQQESTNNSSQEAMEQIFAPRPVETPSIRIAPFDAEATGSGVPALNGSRGHVIGARPSDNPIELDLRATLAHSLHAEGTFKPEALDLYERVRRPVAGTRYLFVIDSSGSHAAQERMRLVKGAVTGLLTRSFRRSDEVAMIVFRGTTAHTLLEPTGVVTDALDALAYIPTGGRTPLAQALHLAKAYVTPSTLLVLLTDGRANVSAHQGDPWQEALKAAQHLRCPALVVDTDKEINDSSPCRELADILGGRCLSLEELSFINDLQIEMKSAQ
jgi:magnesium chelatase subunit D